MPTFGLKAMPDEVTPVSRTLTSPIHDLLSEVQANERYHGRLMTLAEFSLPAEKGKAHQQKQYAVSHYGNNPSILGFSFTVTRSVDNSTEYLGVIFDPSKVVKGAYAKFEAARKLKAAKAKERERARGREKTETEMPPEPESEWEYEPAHSSRQAS